jgi:hypothetical protein
MSDADTTAAELETSETTPALPEKPKVDETKKLPDGVRCLSVFWSCAGAQPPTVVAQRDSERLCLGATAAAD